MSFLKYLANGVYKYVILAFSSFSNCYGTVKLYKPHEIVELRNISDAIT